MPGLERVRREHLLARVIPKRTSRCDAARPAFAAPFLLIPVALYWFFGALTPPATRPIPTRRTYLLTGFAVFGVMGPALFGFGMSLALEREHGTA